MNRFHNQSSLLVCVTNVTPKKLGENIFFVKNYVENAIFYDLGIILAYLGEKTDIFGSKRYNK